MNYIWILILVSLGLMLGAVAVNTAPNTRVEGNRMAEHWPESPPPRRRHPWTIIRGILFKMFCLPFIGLLYFVVISEGFRVMVPVLSLRLYRLPIPGFSRLRDFEGLQRLDLAHLFAIVLCFLTWYFWTAALWLMLAPQEYLARKRWNPVTYGKIMKGIAIALLSADAILFYRGLTEQAGGIFGGSWFSPTAILVTIAYVALIVGIALISVNLDRD